MLSRRASRPWRIWIAIALGVGLLGLLAQALGAFG